MNRKSYPFQSPQSYSNFGDMTEWRERESERNTLSLQNHHHEDSVWSIVGGKINRKGEEGRLPLTAEGWDNYNQRFKVEESVNWLLLLLMMITRRIDSPTYYHPSNTVCICHLPTTYVVALITIARPSMDATDKYANFQQRAIIPSHQVTHSGWLWYTICIDCCVTIGSENCTIGKSFSLNCSRSGYTVWGRYSTTTSNNGARLCVSSCPGEGGSVCNHRGQFS